MNAMVDHGGARPTLRVAVVGSGPAGMYAAAHLFAQRDFAAQVDVFDRLATPFGLVRGGVAPDHLDKKAVVRVFEDAAFHEGFRFFGEVEIGRDVMLEELRGWYDAVILAHGAETARKLEIDGAGCANSLAAGDFLRWANGHPDFSDFQIDLSGRSAVIIGNGNVALDAARLLTQPSDALRRGDAAPAALERLAQSRIEEVWVIGRRGPAFAAFNNPELLELGRLEGVDIQVEASAETLAQALDAAPSWEARLKLETLADYHTRPRSAPRAIRLAFGMSPRAVLGAERCQGVQFDRDGAEEEIAAELALFSVGFAGAALPGAPFDPENNVVPARQGRVNGAEPGLYATGWATRGPKGVIGSNKFCARGCVEALLEDAAAGVLRRGEHSIDIASELSGRGLRPVAFRDWQCIDAREREEGARIGRPRVKYTTREALRRAAFG